MIERAGRRKLMMWGAAGQCFCYIFISALLSQADKANGKNYGSAATAFFFLYYIFFGICWQVRIKLLSKCGRHSRGAGCPLVVSNRDQWYVHANQGFSPRSSIKLVRLCSSFRDSKPQRVFISRISNFIVVQITPIGINRLGWRFYLIWMAFNAAFVPVSSNFSKLVPVSHIFSRKIKLIWLLYPETANRHLEDIDRIYRDNPGLVFVFRKKDLVQVGRPQRFIAESSHVLDKGSKPNTV